MLIKFHLFQKCPHAVSARCQSIDHSTNQLNTITSTGANSYTSTIGHRSIFPMTYPQSISKISQRSPLFPDFYLMIFGTASTHQRICMWVIRFLSKGVSFTSAFAINFYIIYRKSHTYSVCVLNESARVCVCMCDSVSISGLKIFICFYVFYLFI